MLSGNVKLRSALRTAFEFEMFTIYNHVTPSGVKRLTSLGWVSGRHSAVYI